MVNIVSMPYSFTVIGSRERGYVFVCLAELSKTSKTLKIKHEV